MTDTTPGRHPVTFTPMRRAIARRMTDSKQQAPHFYESLEKAIRSLKSGERLEDVPPELPLHLRPARV